jgi:hypothetical protein
MRYLVLLIALAANVATAQCQRISSACFCFSPQQVGVVVTEGVDGPQATVRIESTTRGLDAGAVLTLPREEAEAVGSRWLLLGLERRHIDAADTVSCPAVYLGATRVPTSVAANAVVSPTCDADLEAAGLSAPCNDTVRACSTGPLLVMPMLLLFWFLRRSVRR